MMTDIESYNAELLKEVVEPVATLHVDIDMCEKEIDFSIVGEAYILPCGDYNLYTSDQVAAAILNATKPLEGEIERLKTVPMKYRRMAFNAQLQDENNELRAQLSTAQDEIAHLKTTSPDKREDLRCVISDLCRQVKERDAQLATAEQRVAEACALTYLEDYDLTDIADRIRSGEWRKFMKEGE